MVPASDEGRAVASVVAVPARECSVKTVFVLLQLGDSSLARSMASAGVLTLLSTVNTVWLPPFPGFGSSGSMVACSEVPAGVHILSTSPPCIGALPSSTKRSARS